MDGQTANMIVKCKLPMSEMLAMCAEEASEFAQACLKLRRVLDGTNPTPVTLEMAIADVAEELNDVIQCVKTAGLGVLYDEDEQNRKAVRWVERMGE